MNIKGRVILVSLSLSEKGYNTFALIYRPGALTACEDISRAVAFLTDHADEIGIDMTEYSLWGGSTGARMAAWVGTYGTADGIASWRIMRARIRAIRANGTNAEIDVFPGLHHGSGLGTGTAAEGWIVHAVQFWEDNRR